MSATPPEITLELTGGSLTIRAAEATYHIVVAGGGASAPALAAGKPAPASLPPSSPPPAKDAANGDDDWEELDLSAAIPEEPPADMEDEITLGADGAPQDEAYYKDLSHDMYREVGRLARRLSMSIRDVKVDKVDAFDIESAGDQLENAKDQLESVVKMTEKATLQIMDLGEEIQTAINTARKQMEKLRTSRSEEEDAGGDSESVDQLKEAVQTIAAYLEGLGEGPMSPLIAKAQEVKQALASAPAPAPAPAPEKAPAPAPAAAALRYDFPLELIFQTAYELCTNEAVKKHIKAMWDAGPKAFDNPKMAQSLNSIAPDEPDEDNFLNLNLKEVLKALFSATKVENYKKVLKKMAGTADQIFLDQSLPIEAMPAKPAPAEEAPPEPEPEPEPPAPALDEGALAKLDELISGMEQAGEALAAPELPAPLGQLLESALESAVGGKCEGIDQESCQELEQTLGIVVNSVNSIIEALSFQDLSGQAIYKIVRLLTDFQVQLLAMVVSFGSKIKTREADKKATVDQSEKMAQEEVDKVMTGLGVSEEEEDESPSKLDQDSVNDLLDSMGF